MRQDRRTLQASWVLATLNQLSRNPEFGGRWNLRIHFRPDRWRVEIAYNTFPPFEGRGIATGMVSELLLRAGLADLGIELFAQTLAQANASNAILRKLGFEFGGALEHPEEGVLWEWRRRPGI